MEQKENQKEFEGRIKEVMDFAKEKELSIGACQQISKEGRIENVLLFKDLRPKDAAPVLSDNPEINPQIRP